MLLPLDVGVAKIQGAYASPSSPARNHHDTFGDTHAESRAHEHTNISRDQRNISSSFGRSSWFLVSPSAERSHNHMLTAQRRDAKCINFHAVSVDRLAHPLVPVLTAYSQSFRICSFALTMDNATHPRFCRPTYRGGQKAQCDGPVNARIFPCEVATSQGWVPVAGFLTLPRDAGL